MLLECANADFLTFNCASLFGLDIAFVAKMNCCSPSLCVRPTTSLRLSWLSRVNSDKLWRPEHGMFSWCFCSLSACIHDKSCWARSRMTTQSRRLFGISNQFDVSQTLDVEAFPYRHPLPNSMCHSSRASFWRPLIFPAWQDICWCCWDPHERSDSLHEITSSTLTSHRKVDHWQVMLWVLEL